MTQQSMTEPQVQVDLTVLMDCSEAMAPRMRSARALAAMMPHEVKSLARDRGWNLLQLCARVAPVRAGEDAWASCRSFSLMDEEGTGEYIRHLGSLQPFGESDAVQTMEALKVAMTQDAASRQPGVKVRRMILLMTSAAADEGQRDALNARLGELGDAWDGMDAGKRLCLIAPREEPWSTVAEWENVFSSGVLSGDAPTRADIWETVYFALHGGSGRD